MYIIYNYIFFENGIRISVFISFELSVAYSKVGGYEANSTRW